MSYPRELLAYYVDDKPYCKQCGVPLCEFNPSWAASIYCPKCGVIYSVSIADGWLSEGQLSVDELARHNAATNNTAKPYELKDMPPIEMRIVSPRTSD